MKKKIRIGHSPDADDAFMFYALAKGKIPLGDFEIEHVIEDIESLNRRAFSAELEVTALSCHAYGLLTDKYQLLPYGASVGEGYGPILAAKKGKARNQIQGSRIAVPGRYTTAYLVLQLYENNFQPVFTSFDRVFKELTSGTADFGLLIHEGQLTYQDMGFEKVLDLGEWWKEKYQLPLPLGVNAIRRDLEGATIQDFSRLFRQSIDYTFSHRKEALDYALPFGRGIDLQKGDRFVKMYVNDYSLDLGERGQAGLRFLYDLAAKNGLFPRRVKLEEFEDHKDPLFQKVPITGPS